MKRTTVLMILDGWGYREDAQHNAIAQADTPHWDALWQRYPHAFLETSGDSVGLPDQQMGNSEVGHMTMGAGRVIYQDLTRIDRAIASGAFEQHALLHDTFQTAQQKKTQVHVLGLCSPGGVHAHEAHWHALLRVAQAYPKVTCVLHPFLDGRDVPPQDATGTLTRLMAQLSTLPHVRVGTLMGRFYAMDRDQRWDRTQRAYEALLEAKATYVASDPLTALQQAYARGETDEFVCPTVLSDYSGIHSEDAIISMNFRADRMRQLVRVFTAPAFDGFQRHALWTGTWISLTQYAADLPTQPLFPPQSVSNHLGEYLSACGKTQLRLAETEKYAHVTFFFNGGTEPPYPNEERILVPSPKVATYDLAPEMSAAAVTDELITALRSRRYDLIVCNYANADMVGHTGDLKATIVAIEALDTALGRVYDVLQETGAECLITADHGNAELMYDESSGQSHTAHTSYTVPMLYIGPEVHALRAGTLADVAPTLLHAMGLEVPKEMTGVPLFERNVH